MATQLLNNEQHAAFQAIAGVSMTNLHNWIALIAGAIMVIGVMIVLGQAIWQLSENQEITYMTFLATLFLLILMLCLFLAFLSI